jgi:hypothetical protein
MKMFPDRELINIRHPLGPDSLEAPGLLESGDDPRLWEGFKGDAQYMHSKVFTETPAKQIWSRSIQGQTLASLL